MIKCLAVASIASVLMFQSEPASSKSITSTVDASVAQTRVQLDRGGWYVFPIEVPADIVGKRLDTVLLEFRIDVTLDESENADMTPVIAAYPLEERLSERSPVFATSFPSARNVKPGNDQAVLVDITDIVRRWIADPSSNHGVVVGSFTGPKLNGLELENGWAGPGKIARVTFFYQDRSGERLSTRAR